LTHGRDGARPSNRIADAPRLPHRLEHFVGLAGLLGRAANETALDQCFEDPSGRRPVHAHVVDQFGFGDATAATMNQINGFLQRQFVPW